MIRKLLASLVCASLLAASCGSDGSTDGSQGDSGKHPPETTTAKSEEPGGQTTAEKRGTSEAASGEAAELARAEIGKHEITNMLPADGKQPDSARPLPKNPPNGIEVYPATTNRTVGGAIEYDREPPTNGNHNPLWQNCGVYEQPVQDRHAVHSMDHGVVWITYSPDLSRGQIDSLRSYSREDYVIVSPYPGQNAPVIATAWRVQLELRGANDLRLEEFVNEFRRSELAPLSGNRCTLGVGDPQG